LLQLLQWFNAGTDEIVSSPDLLGCVQLPIPAMCFGVAECIYTDADRRCLLEHLKDERAHILPWPKNVQKCFSKYAEESASGHEQITLLGSPMLDSSLGLVSATKDALRCLTSAPSAGTGNAVNSKQFKQMIQRRDAEEQFDNILAPESNTDWIQCEKCSKWRRVAWYVDTHGLPDNWTCDLNTWDVDSAACDVMQDNFDPASESTVNFSTNVDSGDGTEDGHTAANTVVAVGKYYDVFCNKNLVYYEAKAIGIKPASKNVSGRGAKAQDAPGTGSHESGRAVEPRLIKFHFKGWKSTFDEWIPEESDRICMLHTHTLPDMRSARDQERWQGLELEVSANNTCGKSSAPKALNDRKLAAKQPSAKTNTSCNLPTIRCDNDSSSDVFSDSDGDDDDEDGDEFRRHKQDSFGQADATRGACANTSDRKPSEAKSTAKAGLKKRKSSTQKSNPTVTSGAEDSPDLTELKGSKDMCSDMDILTPINKKPCRVRIRRGASVLATIGDFDTALLELFTGNPYNNNSDGYYPPQ
jgi:hypothetical protein